MVDSIPQQVRNIYLSCHASKSQRPFDYCNVVNDDMSPLPFRRHLQNVWLQRFTAANGGKVPIDKLLFNNRHIITKLRIHYSRIGSTDRGYFAGFGKLQLLELQHNDITGISIDAFDSLAGERSMKPSLADLYLDDNALETFDWGALYPLRHTLTQLHLDDQKPKMHSLTLSGRAFNTSIQHLYIQDNSLKSVPVGVLDSIGWNSFIPASLNIARNAFCEGFTDCSCCEMAYLVSWAKKITLMERPSSVYTSVTLSCGSQSDLISINREKFHIVPDWFDHCDTAITTVITSSTGIPKSATRISTYAGASNHNSSALCRETKPIEINCSSGRLTIPEPDLSHAEGTVVTFRIDRSFGCISKLYNLHTMALELFNVSEQTGIQQHPHEEINVDCISGLPTISSTDPENSHARQLTFRSDFTSECFPKFTEFLNHIHINIVTDDNMYSVATGNAEHELLDPMWRTCGNIVTANCTEGTFVFSHIQYIALLADGVVIRIDQSFDCRSTLVAIHEHILAQEMTVVQPRPPEPLPKSIAVVCSKGHVLVSEGHPRRSKKTIIEYSAKPSKFCRATFQKFMEYLFGL